MVTLAKITDESYKIRWDHCGDPIPEARLKAIPGVGLCLACQEEWEKERF
jgi:RNA polymerase-binding transcription factor DksA